MINVVLYQPEIPPNTGNIARLCVCANLRLHIIHPAGFSLSKKKLLRAGLDYWDHLLLTEHNSWEDFLTTIPKDKISSLSFFSSKSNRSFWKNSYKKDPYLIFGSETRGLPQALHMEYPEQFFTIPMKGAHARCLNLSNSVSIAAYEVLRQGIISSES